MFAQYFDQINEIWVYSIDFSAFAVDILFTKATNVIPAVGTKHNADMKFMKYMNLHIKIV